VLLRLLGELGATDAVRTLLARDPASRADLDNPAAVGFLLTVLDVAGADDAVRTLTDRAASHTSLDVPWFIPDLLTALGVAGADDAVRTLTDRAASHASLHDPEAVAQLLSALRDAGADDAARALAARSARAVSHSSYASLDDPQDAWMEWAPPAAAAESADADSYFGLNDPETSVDLLRALREAGADEAVHALAARAANAGEFSLSSRPTVTQPPISRSGASRTEPHRNLGTGKNRLGRVGRLRGDRLGGGFGNGLLLLRGW
jgi:hypothetical protein